jgi:hypothetical protein
MGVPCSSVPDRDVAVALHLSNGGIRGKAASRLAHGRLWEPVRQRGRGRRPACVAVPSLSLRRRGEAEEDGARDREKETGRHRCRRRRKEDRWWREHGQGKRSPGEGGVGGSGHEGIWEERRRRHKKVGVTG